MGACAYVLVENGSAELMTVTSYSALSNVEEDKAVGIDPT